VIWPVEIQAHIFRLAITLVLKFVGRPWRM